MAQVNAVGAAFRPLSGGGVASSIPQVLHFKPPGLSLPVAAIFPMGVAKLEPTGVAFADAALKEHRRALHTLLRRPTETPLFRVSQVYDIEAAAPKPGSRIRTPHATLKPSGVVDGTLYLTKGCGAVSSSSLLSSRL